MLAIKREDNRQALRASDQWELHRLIIKNVVTQCQTAM
jgi:hypothetical protein